MPRPTQVSFFPSYFLDPPPPHLLIQVQVCLLSNLDIFQFESILMAEDPLGQTSFKGYLGIFKFQKGYIKGFIFPFLGWGLRVMCNSLIFEKILKLNLGFFFFNPQLGNFPQIF